ncbi:heme NO-binding domain-containing protein [Salinicola halophyticus]|uniref:heme NO-binding domain-containing protein n=1 Tax=Salinicola halophyticus TaxID=1808881 RepID=UPI000DA2543E|nr:heme NO-binding domain-containing protein [Salinicola halophyticus]
MIGLIQRVLIDHVESHYGEAAVDRIAAQAGVSSPGRRIDTDYDDADTLAFFEAAGDYLELHHEALMTLYADLFINWTRRHYPMFFSMADSAQAFLGRQPAIHASLGAGIRDPDLRSRVNDKFRVVDQSEGALIVEYRSANGLCSLYRALFARVLAEYAQSGELAETRCRHRGDDCCRFEMTFATGPGSLSGSVA